MNTKTQISIRLDKKLMAALKECAKADNRSLNSYIEKILKKDVGNIPNATTLAAIEEARNGKLERIENIDDWFEKL